MRYLRQNTAASVQIGPFLDSDAAELAMFLLPWPEIQKHGAGWGNITYTDDIETDVHGWAAVPLAAADVNTVGPLMLRVVAGAGALPVWHEFMVLPQAAYDALIAGTDLLSVDLTQIMGAGLDGNNATLRLKSIDVSSDVGGTPAVLVQHTFGGTAMRLIGDTDGSGLHIVGGVEGTAVAVQAGGDYGNGLTISGGNLGGSAIDVTSSEGGRALFILSNNPNEPAVKINSASAPAVSLYSGGGGSGVDMNGDSPAGALALADVASAVTDMWNRIGAFAGSGVNTVLGFLRALMRKDLQAPSDVGGTFSPATDSLEAIKDAGVPSTNAATPGAAMTLTSAYDRAKTAAAPGEAMTLTPAYDAAKNAMQAGTAVLLDPAAVTAVQSGLARPGDAMTLTPAYEAAKSAAQPGDTMALTPAAVAQVRSGLAHPGDAMTLTVAYDAAKTAAPAGSAMDLTPAAVAAVQSGLAQPGDAMTLTAAYEAAKTPAQAGDSMNLTPEAIAAVTAGGTAPTAGEIADAVWDESAAEHSSAGSTGAKLNSAATGGDPWTKPLPGAYPAGSAGAILGAMSGTKVTVQSPVAANGLLRLIQGDSYDDGKLAITVAWNGEDLTGPDDVRMYLTPRDHYQADSGAAAPVEIVCTLSVDGNAVTVTMPISDELSALFEGTPSDSTPNYVYQIVVTKGERRHTLALGPAIIRRKVG